MRRLVTAEVNLILSVKAQAFPIALLTNIVKTPDLLPPGQQRDYAGDVATIRHRVATQFSTAQIERSQTVATVKNLAAKWSFVVQEITDLYRGLFLSLSFDGADTDTTSAAFTAEVNQTRTELNTLAAHGKNVTAALAALGRIGADIRAFDAIARPAFRALAGADYTSHTSFAHAYARAKAKVNTPQADIYIADAITIDKALPDDGDDTAKATPYFAAAAHRLH